MKDQIPFILLDDKNSEIPLYRQIYQAIQTAILNGEFSPRMRLPSSRDLAKQLGVSRITVVNAYEQLFAEGYLEGKTGAGTFVARDLPDDLLAAPNLEKISLDTKSGNDLNLSPFGQKLAESKNPMRRPKEILTFQNGLTAIEQFPFDVWSRIAAKHQKNPKRSLLGYGDPAGFLPLREAVAAHLRSARGVKCDAAQVVITSGAQQALDLSARIFLSENDSAIVEDPCYQEARSSFSATGARIVPVPVDSEGLNLSKTPIEGENAKLVYVTPSHQYPLGIVMSLPQRLALIEWAKQRNAWIIEDDYNSEFRYSGRPLASLQGLDPAARVIYVGTFSKTIFPALRIGCAVVPPELVGVFAHARALNDVHSSAIDQAILADFISEGHFSRHIRRMRKLYEERQSILLYECRTQLADFIEIGKNEAGMHLVGWLKKGFSDQKISEAAFFKGLRLAAVSSYYSSPPQRQGLIFGYTAFDETQIKLGIAKLREIFLSLS